MKKQLILTCLTFLFATAGAVFGQRHAYIWDAANGPRDLGSLGGESFAVAINDSGTVVGSYVPTGQSYHGFIWTEATGMVALGIPGGGDSSAALCVPTAINSAGHVVGYGRQVDGRQVAFYWTAEDGFTTLSEQSSDCYSCNAAFAINDLDQITGSLLTTERGIVYDAFLWSPGMVHSRHLGTVNGNGGSIGYGINGLGRIVGGSNIGSVWGPMTWTKQTGMRSLGTIDGSEFAQAWAVNDAGQIIGHANLPTSSPSFYTAPGVHLRFLKGLGGSETYASAINQNGVMVGSASDSTNATYAVLWNTPSSTPIVLPLGAAYGLNNAEQVVGDGPDGEP